MLFSLAASSLGSSEVIFRFTDGSSALLDLDRMETVSQIKGSLMERLGLQHEKWQLLAEGRSMHPDEVVTTYDGQEFWVDLDSGIEEVPESAIPKKTHVGYRQYQVSVSESDKEDIRYILKSLAEKSLTSLWGMKSKLEAAGERIDHLHPLRFLECIFTDDELKVYIYNIKKRGSWVWGEFIKGFKDTFQEESEIGNIKEEYLQDFVNNLGIELSLVYDLFQSKRWEDFVKTLIANVPREGDSGRYDQ